MVLKTALPRAVLPLGRGFLCAQLFVGTSSRSIDGGTSSIDFR